MRKRKMKYADGGLVKKLKNIKQSENKLAAENYKLSDDAVDYIYADKSLSKSQRDSQAKKQLKLRNRDSKLGFGRTRMSKTAVLPKKVIDKASKNVKEKGLESLKLADDELGKSAQVNMKYKNMRKQYGSGYSGGGLVKKKKNRKR